VSSSKKAIRDLGIGRAVTRPQDRKGMTEFEFVPRIVNPTKMRRVVVLSADEEIRSAGPALREQMPWVEVSTLSDPIAASRYSSAEATAFVFDDTAMALVRAEEVRKNNQDAVLVLLSSNPFIHCSPPQMARERFPYTVAADLVFATHRNELPVRGLIAAVVRAAEDRLNIERYSKVRRFIFLVVDDEPRWFSQFLPVLYDIIGQRADVMVTRTYEETLAFLFGSETGPEEDEGDYRLQGHGDDVVCLITDIFIPKGRDLSGGAGRDLIALVRKYYPRYPIIVASKAKEAEDLRGDVFVMPKGDPGSLEKMRDYVLNDTGMGDFLVRDEAGREVRRVRSIYEMHRILKEAEGDTEEAATLRERLDVYGEHDRFSTWLYMHSFRELGDRLRPLRHRGPAMLRALERNLRREILQMQRTPLVVGEARVFGLLDLVNVLRSADPAVIHPLSDDDVLSSWLDRKGYPELAEELRPIHGSGPELITDLLEHVERWLKVYRERGEAP
jgi:hypothetical protein